MPKSLREILRAQVSASRASALNEGDELLRARRSLLARIVPKAKSKRRRDRLGADESEKTERLASRR